MKIIILNEKHGDRYFKYDGKVHLKLLKVIKDRQSNGWYNFSYEKPEKPLLPEKSPDWVIAEYKKQLRDYNDAYFQYISYSDERELLEKALSGKKQAIFDFLESRSDHEYEGFIIEELE